MSNFSHWTIKELDKVAKVLEVLENADLNVNEFTKKDFEKVFKGTKEKNGACSLEWLRENGFDTKNKEISCSWRASVVPFVKLVREEELQPIEVKKWNWWKHCEEVITVTPKRNFYSMNVDALREILNNKPIEDIKNYYKEKIEKLNKQIATANRMIDGLNLEIVALG